MSPRQPPKSPITDEKKPEHLSNSAGSNQQTVASSSNGEEKSPEMENVSVTKFMDSQKSNRNVDS